jgi:hypothetical protein
MKNKIIRLFQILILNILFFSTFRPAVTAQAMTGPLGEGQLPSLDTFVTQVRNGHADELRGVYIPGLLAAPVVQQSSGMDDFVSPWQNVLTQFRLASRFGSTGLLAHNYLAGETFSLLENGQEIQLVYGDGHVSRFTVRTTLHYQVLDSSNKSGTFLDLETHTSVTASDLFNQIYNQPGRVIFQTCIQAGDHQDWGRLFVIAEPMD